MKSLSSCSQSRRGNPFPRLLSWALSSASPEGNPASPSSAAGPSDHFRMRAAGQVSEETEKPPSLQGGWTGEEEGNDCG